MQTPHNTLDPENWQSFRQQSHRMLDDILDYVERIRERPVWQPIPDEVRGQFHEPLPHASSELAEVHQTFMDTILPYAVGNAHPGFMGWVQGGGNPVGMVAEMLAAGLNANVGGRDQIPVEVEWQIVAWMRELFEFPETASGLFVTGTSLANLMSVWVARTRVLGQSVRQQGMAAAQTSQNAQKLRAYTSAGAHGCVAQAMDLAGLGKDALRMIPMNEQFEMDMEALKQAIAEDRAAGFIPFYIAGTAGSVDVGAIDPLSAIADLAQQEQLWFHIDGAFGALGKLSPEIAPYLKGIERADSIAFDFHKWGQVPYDSGFILLRDKTLHLNTFAADVQYLRREPRGLAAGSVWPCDLGLDLSRGFRALKTWFTIKVYGADKLGEIVASTCAIARYLKQRIEAEEELELLAPVKLNIVCFRYRCAYTMDALDTVNAVNAEIAIRLQESGIAAPSTTVLKGQLAIRAAIVNHRTTTQNIDALIEAALVLGRQITALHNAGNVTM